MHLFKKHTLVILETVLIFLFILLFVYAAVSKLIDFHLFQSQLRQSPLLGAYAELVSWFIPFSEILISFFLAIRHYRLIGLYGFYILMVMFTAYILIILNFTDFIPCSCGGVLEDLSWREHLIFNLIFVLLSFAIILFKEKVRNTKIYLIIKLLLLAGVSSSFVILLFILSENETKRNNAFQRRLPPHPITYIHSIDLGYNSYYLSGVDDETVYLGNVTTPLKLLLVDKRDYLTTEQPVIIDQMEHPYTLTEVRVKPPYFYVYDGTIPIVFKGKTADWKAKMLLYEEAYFTQLAILDSASFVFRALSSSDNEHIIGRMQVLENKVSVKLNYDLLTTQQDGIFETDGNLVYNPDTGVFFYTYYYTNDYVAFNPDLSLRYRGKTIDTFSQAQIRVDTLSQGKRSLINPASTTVNIHSASSGNRLYIQSDRLGRFEADEIIEKASIIDVYEIDSKNYLYSFYVFDERGSKLDSFVIYKDEFIALMGNYLVIYSIRNP